VGAWLLALALGLMPHTVSGQAQGQKPQPAGSQIQPQQRVRVPTSYANVHMGPSSGQEVLVLVPRGTTLTVVARDKEWLQVQLTPELRKTGMVMRWYKNEERGWMHDSTVELVKPGT
jgi:hypothetical protein